MMRQGVLPFRARASESAADLDPSCDPYRHHPGLRDRIAPPLASFFRTFQPSTFDAQVIAAGGDTDWRYPDHSREAMRAATLAGRLDRDLWVFAYGSLMWDPAFCFAEVRRGAITGFARRFILLDTYGARGSREEPGLMVALDHGDGCQGLAFRIAGRDVAAETEILWRRELLGPAYLPAFVTVTTDFGPVEALTVVANHASPVIRPDLSRAQQVQYIATGRGMLGSSREYIENIAGQCAALELHDPELSGLLAEVRAWPGRPQC